METAHQRWSKMWISKKVISINDEQLFLLNLDMMREEVDILSEKNKVWNIRTLILLEKAGFIKIHYSDLSNVLPVDANFETLNDSDVRQLFNSVHVAVKKAGHTDLEIWRRLIKPIREEEARQASENFQQYENFLRKLNVPLCKLFEDYYTLDNITPEYACSGCNGDHKPHLPTLGVNFKVYDAQFSRSELFDNCQSIYVYYTQKEFDDGRVYRMLDSLINYKGIQAIRAEPYWHQMIARKLEFSNRIFYCSLEMQEKNQYWDEIIFVEPNSQHIPKIPVSLDEHNELYVIPECVKDETGNRRFIDVYADVLPLNNLIRS